VTYAPAYYRAELSAAIKGLLVPDPVETDGRWAKKESIKTEKWAVLKFTGWDEFATQHNDEQNIWRKRKLFWGSKPSPHTSLAPKTILFFAIYFSRHCVVSQTHLNHYILALFIFKPL
jgi:hypothetical protein